MPDAIVVTADNFIRAETDRAVAGEVQAHSSLGKFAHRRELIALTDQVVPRVNHDTLYSTAVFDLDAGPVTMVNPGSSNITHEPVSSSFTLMFTDGRSVVTLYSLPARTLVSPSAVNSLPLRLREIGFLP